jgi:protein gp37
MGATTIQWTERTWNPVRGCSRVSAGCQHCYAERQAWRFSGPGKPYAGLVTLQASGPMWTGDVRTLPEKLTEPLHWKQPQRIFVNSMADLFHARVPDTFIVDVFNVMMQAHWHTFQVLTKRPQRMAELLPRLGWRAHVRGNPQRVQHIWLGTSIEHQEVAGARCRWLQQTPAVVRFLSCEPLLGPIRLHARSRDGLAWVILGGESGPRARPAQLGWFRDLIAQCRAAGVAVFVKQLGAVLAADLRLSDRKGGAMAEWPEDLRIREVPHA